MPDVVISEFMAGGSVARLSREFDVLYDPTLVDDVPRLEAAIEDSRALIVRNRTTVGRSILDSGAHLQVIGRLGVGLDNIDLNACAERSIAVKPATGANADAVAEYVVAAVLLLVRGVFRSSDDVAEGAWPRTDLVGYEIGNKTMGLIGLGDIARRVARSLGSLGMDIAAFDPLLEPTDEAWSSVRRASFDEVIADADAISIHVPLTEATHMMIDGEALASMKPTAVLVNTSRGGIVDEDAVVTALRSGDLRGAALDVFEAEPLTAERGKRFAGVPGLVLTPHIAGVTRESNVRVSDMVAQAVGDVLREGTGE